MRIENKVEHLNTFANNAIKSKESNHSFAAMLNQYSNNSQAINQKAEVESLGVFDFSLLLHKNVSKQIKETKEKTESKIRQLEEELYKLNKSKSPQEIYLISLWRYWIKLGKSTMLKTLKSLKSKKKLPFKIKAHLDILWTNRVLWERILMLLLGFR